MNYIIPLKISECYIITSQFHMNRTQTIFNYFNELVLNSSINLKYIETENIIDSEILKKKSRKRRN